MFDPQVNFWGSFDPSGGHLTPLTTRCQRPWTWRKVISEASEFRKLRLQFSNQITATELNSC